MKCLIAGGLGFIGSNLARRLVLEGHQVTAIDSLIPQYGGNLANVADIRDKITVNISDVRDPFATRELLKGVYWVFNLAGQTSHADSMADPYTALTSMPSHSSPSLRPCVMSILRQSRSSPLHVNSMDAPSTFR